MEFGAPIHHGWQKLLNLNDEKEILIFKQKDMHLPSVFGACWSHIAAQRLKIMLI